VDGWIGGSVALALDLRSGWMDLWSGGLMDLGSG